MRTNQLISILLLFSLSVAAAEQSYDFAWAQGASGGSPNGLAIDEQKNTYVCGYFGTMATFGSTTVTNGGNSGAFLAKYDAQGNFQWVRSSRGETGTSAEAGAAAFKNGDVYLAGRFSGPVGIGNTNLPNGRGCFLSKFDLNGVPVWTRPFSGNKHAQWTQCPLMEQEMFILQDISKAMWSFRPLR